MLSEWVVQPPSTLRMVPNRLPTTLLNFCKTHGLTKKYFVPMLDGNSPDHKGWQRLDRVRWLHNICTGEYVIVVGGAKLFLECERAKRADMSFNYQNLKRFLAGAYVDGAGNSIHLLKKTWDLMPVGFQPPQVATLEDGASLARLFSAPSLAAARSLTQPHMALPENGTLNLGAVGAAAAPLLAEPSPEVRRVFRASALPSQSAVLLLAMCTPLPF